MKKGIVFLVASLLVLAAAFWAFGDSAPLLQKVQAKLAKPEAATADVPAPAITAQRVKAHDFVETVLVTGSFIARDEVVVAPELEGLKIVELKVDEGDRVQAGDVLAQLQDEALKYQLAQREAALKRATAAIAQAKSQIKEAKARQHEATASLKRAKPLRKKKYIAQSVIDQRRASAISATAQVASAEEGLRVAEASKAELEAQRNELKWRVSRTEIRAPVSGLVSKRNARIGEIAIGANAFSGEAPMFRLIANNEIELDAEVPETLIAKIQAGQTAIITVTGIGPVTGKVRLVSPEIDKTTRLGRVRIFFGDDPRLKIGSFGRGTIQTRSGRGLAVPLSAVIYTSSGPSVLVIKDDIANARRITLGLRAGDQQEVTSGLQEGDVIVAKAGTFLRDGDAVKAILPEPQVSEAH
ncbi:MAG: efflux RND transporter periplasmic adaptor subunit [Alphaproteobacteria bacterium]|nr:efflux RND transporter periplasmic adaptor subunit [Alphaproteobacteria bacterium]